MATAPLKVLATQDNPNGTSTNYLSDGSADTGTYTKNPDGTLNFKPVAPLVPSQAPVAPATPNTAIPLSTLQAPNPVVAQTQIPATTSATEGFQGYLAATTQQNNDQFQQELNQKATTAQTTSASSLDQYLRTALGAPTPTELTNSLYNTGGVDTAKADLQDINNQITAEQVAARHRIEKIQKNNPLGKSADAIAQEVDQVSRESISKQADLAVIQLSKQGKYDSAKEIADRAVTAITERQKVTLDVLGKVYESNKDLFDKADQRAFEVAQKSRQTKLDNDEYRLRAEFDEKIRTSSEDYRLGLEQKRADIANTYSTIGERNAKNSPQAAATKNATTAGTVGNALTAIQTANKQINGLSTGLIGGFARHVGGTQAANLASTIDTVKSALTFDTLNQLKANSPTGASGLGALSDNEAKLLASQVASLDTSQSPAQLKANLATVQQHYVDYLSTLGYGYDDKTNTIIAP